MASGADSTLVLHPEGLSDITFDLTGGASRTGGYVVSLDTLRLNEDRRLEIAYSGGPNVEGGEAISSSAPLVPVTFSVIVYDTTLAAMVQKAEALLVAATNARGGTLEYKPDGLGGSVRSTFYHYEQSPPPKVRERWDRGAHDSGLYRMQVEVELQTQPFCTSDPDNPVSVLNAVTIYNQDNVAEGYIYVVGTNIKGTEPALVQLRVRNMVGGAWAAIEKLYYARRTEGDQNYFSPVLEGGTPDTASSIHWSTESDTTRRSDNYQRYAPPEAANDQWASLQYTISNITEHEGKAAVAVICRSLAESREDWDLKAALQVADVIVETGVKNVAQVGTWTICVLGELDIPPTPISDDESYATDLYLYLRRTSGDVDNAMDVDFVMLLYVDEYPQLVTVTDGFTSSHKLFMENFKRELCHVVDMGTLALQKTASPLCPLLKLRAGVDNRVDFIWERITSPIEDDFEDYEAWYWRVLAHVESTEDWQDVYEWNTAENVEGDQCLRFTPEIGGGDSSYLVPSTPWDMTLEGRLGDDDFVYIYAYGSGDADYLDLYLRFRTGDSDYYQYEWSSVGTGRHFFKAKKSAFSSVGSPDWSSIANLNVYVNSNGGTGATLYVDDIRISRADPDDATKGNDTGSVWDFMTDVWHVYEPDEDGDHALGCIDITAALEQVALIHEEPPANVKFLASVRAKRDDGDVGLIFRCEDGTSGSEDMAALFLDTANDQLELRKWAAGSASNIAASLGQVVVTDTDYWLGVWLIEDRIRGYFSPTKSLMWDDENKEFEATGLWFDVTDSDFVSGGALSGGQVGLLSVGTLGRFDDVEVYGLAGHVPGDSVQVEAKAVFRSIYPFRE